MHTKHRSKVKQKNIHSLADFKGIEMKKKRQNVEK